MATIVSPADVVNLALGRIGYKLRVGDLYEGSMEAKAALDIYGQTRDELLRQGNYEFSQRNIQMALLKSAPVTGYFPPNLWNPLTNPPPGWLYEYTYPDDCLKVGAVKQAPLQVINFDPQPNRFSIENDNNYAPARKVILCNVQDAFLTYTARVTDPKTWESDFIEEFAAALGRRLAPALTNMEAAKAEAADEQNATSVADSVQG